jgi:hypothetical protein
VECESKSDTDRATGTLSEALRKNLRNIPGKHKIKKKKKPAILGTAHILRIVLM